MPDIKQIGVGVAFLILILCVVIVITKPWSIRAIGHHQPHGQHGQQLPAGSTSIQKQSPTQTKNKPVKPVQQQQKAFHAAKPLYTLSASATGPVSSYLQLPNNSVHNNTVHNTLNNSASDMPLMAPIPPMPMPIPPMPVAPTPEVMSPPIPMFKVETPEMPKPDIEKTVDNKVDHSAPKDTKEETHRAELLRGSSVGRTKMATPTTSAMMMASINTRDEAGGKQFGGSTALMERLTGRSISQAERDFMDGKESDGVPEPYRP